LNTVEQWAPGGFAGDDVDNVSDVPWIAPYYERMGWRWLDQSELTPGLAAIREHETARALDRWPRVAMRY
jgi:hypothetical protein